MSKQEEINSLIKSHGVKQSWLAERLGIKSQTLEFLLNDSDKFDDDLYESIVRLVSTYQYELKLFDEDGTSGEPQLFDEQTLKKGIGGRIRIFAKRKYATLKNLAEAMQISPQQLQQYISGNREPGSKILIRFLRLGCDINWLLGGAESLESYRIYKLENEIRKLQSALAQVYHVSNDLLHSHHKEKT
jgi:transcriptional regulator with XRE-family HTH domain